MKLTVGPASLPIVAEHISKHARSEDKLEWERGLGVPFEESFSSALAADKQAVAMFDSNGTPVCVWGGFVHNPYGLYVWLVATRAVDKLNLSAHRHLKNELNKLHKRCDTLVAVADSENVVHHRWLTWLGFKKQEVVHIQPRPHSVPHPFIVFRRTNTCA